MEKEALPARNGFWLAEIFERFYPKVPDVPLRGAYVYPTVEGGVQLEWSLGSKEISLEVTLADHSAELGSGLTISAV